MSETTIGNWERGAERPRIRHLTDILEFIGFDPEPGPPDLAGRLRGVRRRLGLTQADLAIRLGQDEKQICRWERGRAQPHPAILSRVENGLSALEGRPLIEVDSPLSFFHLTRWRRNMPVGATTVEPLTLGDRMRARRLELRMSATLVARRSGTNRGTLYRIECGRQRPTQNLEHRLREILELDAAE